MSGNMYMYMHKYNSAEVMLDFNGLWQYTINVVIIIIIEESVAETIFLRVFKTAMLFCPKHTH